MTTLPSDFRAVSRLNDIENDLSLRGDCPPQGPFGPVQDNSFLSFCKHLLGTQFVPGIMPGAEDTVEEIQFLLSWSL